MSEETRNTAVAADPLAPKAVPVPVLEYRSVVPPQGQTIEMTARTLRILQQTCPWATAIAGLMLVGGTLIVVTGLYMLVGGGQPFAAGEIAVIGLSLAVPSVFLSRYATYTRKFVHTADGRLLEKGLESSWMFWKVLASAVVIVALVMVLGVLALFGMIHM
ncbi:MAG: hypothetical protein ABSH20_04475 [Tepidisphaeraceae bacterium]|jgi:hypothetical protein